MHQRTEFPPESGEILHACQGKTVMRAFFEVGIIAKQAPAGCNTADLI